MYNPLHPFLTIRDSVIHGKGIFAVRDISINFNLGITHIYDDKFSDNYIRTPLGGFINHSDNPNCIKMPYKKNYLSLYTIKNIKANQEITVEYTLYEITN
tara:strand:- start:1113 stop:1412 length:300 start_codon:yes stop_codon:yes gene_type:complete